jgi:hypothetical protein
MSRRPRGAPPPPVRFPNVAVRFFESFARFENALKRAGYLKNKEIAEADWDRFARDLEPSFLDDVRASGQASTLISQPPKRRVTRNDRLEWQEAQQVTDAASLFNAIRRARNNLYHGEKFIGAPSPDNRDKRLLGESLWVLEFALSKNANLRTKYQRGHEPIP